MAGEAASGVSISNVDGTAHDNAASTGDCGTITENLTYVELTQLSGAGDTLFHVPEQARDLVAATPAGGQQRYLDDTCELMANALVELDVPSEGSGDAYRDSPAMQAGMIGSGYNFCTGFEGTQHWDSSETFEADPRQYGVNDSFRLANEDLCPQIEMPESPS